MQACMVMRAETAVNDELVEDMDFTNAVGESEFNRYAQEVVDSSYLDIESKSLNNQAYNNSITRAEAIYLLMNRYFSDELESVDTKGVAFNDCKDGGDIGEKQQFAGKERAKLYELAYMLQNPDKGVSTDLYKAIVLANEKQIILGNTCWDEAITKSEALEMLIETLRQEDKEMQFASKAGTYEHAKENNLVENGGNESLSENGENESLSVDVQDGVNSTGEGTLLGEDDYQEEISFSDEDLQAIYDSFSDEDKELFKEYMADEDLDLSIESGNVQSSTGTVSSAGTEEVIYSDPDWGYRFEHGDYSNLSDTAIGY